MHSTIDNFNTIEHMCVKNTIHLQEYLKLKQGSRFSILVMRYVHIVVILNIYVISDRFCEYTLPLIRL